MQQRSGPYGPPSQNQLLLISVHSFIVFHTWSVEMTCSDWSIVAFWFYLCITLSLLRGFGFFFNHFTFFFFNQRATLARMGQKCTSTSFQQSTHFWNCVFSSVVSQRQEQFPHSGYTVGQVARFHAVVSLPTYSLHQRSLWIFFQQMKYSIKQWTFHNIR